MATSTTTTAATDPGTARDSQLARRVAAHRRAKVAECLASFDVAGLRDSIRARLCERAYQGDVDAVQALLIGHY